MSSVCFYFQVHQPFRIKNYPYFKVGKDHSYFDEKANREIMQKVAHKCYLPANRLMLELINRYQGAFRIAYSITGVAIEQMERYSPETLQSFIELSKTGCVEFLGETYYHSLSSLYHSSELCEQISRHAELIHFYFDQKPKVFRNTELIYSDAIGNVIEALGYKAMLAEGADDILDWRSPHFVYRKPGGN